MADEPALYTIGHSRHSTERFLELLGQHSIQTLVDVRSQPLSRFAPQFNRRTLARALDDAGIEYVFAGDELGGRPPESEFYDGAGYVLYGRVAGSARFRSALKALQARLDGPGRVAVMCAEEDPAACHRRLLIGRSLEDEGVEIRHIRGDGRLEKSNAPGRGRAAAEQGRLFGDLRDAWRSAQPVRPASPDSGG